MTAALSIILPPGSLQLTGTGPLYVKLRQSLEDAIRSGKLAHGDALPAERELADYANVSRVTVRKAVDDLVKAGLLSRRQGSGTFVTRPMSRVEQTLTRLTSFTEDMTRRGVSTRSEWLDRGLYHPSPDEIVMLGLSPGARVARVGRLRYGNDVPLAIERASISQEFLPDPSSVTVSLYAELEKQEAKPVRAIQRISAGNIKKADAALLQVPVGAAGLTIQRVSYLATGRVVELTRSLYRGDAYDFVAELSLEND